MISGGAEGRVTARKGARLRSGQWSCTGIRFSALIIIRAQIILRMRDNS